VKVAMLGTSADPNNSGRACTIVLRASVSRQQCTARREGNHNPGDGAFE
jgi:hypothetical protein